MVVIAVPFHCVIHNVLHACLHVPFHKDDYRTSDKREDYIEKPFSSQIYAGFFSLQPVTQLIIPDRLIFFILIIFLFPATRNIPPPVYHHF